MGPLDALPRLQVGDAFTSVVEWIEGNLPWLLDTIKTVLKWAVNQLDTGLTYIPVLVTILALAAIGWYLRSWAFGVYTLGGFVLIANMEMWDESMSSLALVIVASVCAMGIAVPLGVVGARSHNVSRIIRPLMDMMQTMPAFVYLIPTLFFFSIGVVSGVVATVVFAIPPGVRLTELGLRQVDGEMLEAGQAFGASPWQVLSRIQIPLALPTIMAGVNQVIMLSLSMVVIAGMVGAGGLGGVVYEGVTRLNLSKGFEGGLAVVILAIYLDRLTGALADRAPVARALRVRSTAE
ncbi:MAG: ABC transporter permease subunit [Microthrixaceae bacterium]